jgi:hypothetical protein
MDEKPGVYRHYKGNRYELIGFARHSETREAMAIYRALYGERELWVRPASMWSELVEVDGKQVKRFALVGEAEKSRAERAEAHRSIALTLSKCEKALTKLREGSPQHTLTQRRIAAFRLALELIEREQMTEC